MDRSFKITINLLPHLEPKNAAIQRRFHKIQAISTVLILLLFFTISIVFALTILQKSNLDKIADQVTISEKSIGDQKSKEAALILLKNRLVSINTIQSDPSKQREILTIVSRIQPSSIFANSLSTDRSGNLILSFVSNDVSSIDKFIDDLVDNSKNDNKIASLDLDSLSRGRDGVYRVSLKVNVK